MKIGKLFMLAIAPVLAVALVAAVLTACDPDTPIDTKGTVYDLVYDLKQESNFTFTVNGIAVGDTSAESVSTYYGVGYFGSASVLQKRQVSRPAAGQVLPDRTVDYRYEFGTYGLKYIAEVEMLGYPIDYGYVEGKHTIDMTVTRSANDEPGPYSARDTVSAFIDTFATMLADGEDGIVFNEKFDVGYVIGVSGETYIPNTGSVTVTGEYVKAVFSTRNGDVTTEWTCTIDDIGTTKVLIPDGVGGLADYRELPSVVAFDFTDNGKDCTYNLTRVTPVVDDSVEDIVVEYRLGGTVAA